MTLANVTSHARRWWALGSLSITVLMVALDATVINIALPRAQLDLHSTVANREWPITAYALAFGSLMLLGGRLSDLWGRRTSLLVGLTGFALASAVGGARRTVFDVGGRTGRAGRRWCLAGAGRARSTYYFLQ